MNLEGRIDITLTRQGGVSIRSTRPQLAQRLLDGRTPEEAAHLAGLVFSLCGKAQRVAAQAACEAAAGQLPNPVASRERAIAVLLELAQEHAWRLLLDGPRRQGSPEDQASLMRLRQAAAEPLRFAATLDELLRNTLLGEPAAVWLARDLAAFDDWRRAAATPTARLFAELGEGADLGSSQARLLPSLDRLSTAEAADLAGLALDAPDFSARPTLYGEPAETGALARVAHPLLAEWIEQRGRGAGARLLARLLELAELPPRLSDGIGDLSQRHAGPALVRAWSLGDDVGLAGVETARGLLLHVVRLLAGKVDQYRIVAPTEWNFHPAGSLLQALAGLAPGHDLAARAHWLCQSLDPCVAYAIEVQDA